MLSSIYLIAVLYGAEAQKFLFLFLVRWLAEGIPLGEANGN
jgi:hypothetical protein